MGACGSKPKVLGDKLRREPRNLTSNTLQSFSSAGQPSFKDNQRSLSFSPAPDDKASITSHDDKPSLSFPKSPRDDTQHAPPIASREEEDEEEEDSNPNAIVAIDNNDRSDELPSNHNSRDDDDDRDHDIPLEYTTEDETDDTISEDGQNGVVEGPKPKDEVAGPTPTDEHDQTPNTPSAAIMNDDDDDDAEATSPAGLHPQTSLSPHTPQNDVVDTLLTPPAAGVLEPQDDAVTDDDEETSSSSENSPPNTDEKEKEKEKENVVAEALRTSPPGLITLVSSSPMAHHKSKEVLVFDHIPLIETAMSRESPSAAAPQVHHAGPTYHQHIAVRDHRVLQVASNKGEVTTDDQRGNFVTSNSNAMPSTFAF